MTASRLTATLLPAIALLIGVATQAHADDIDPGAERREWLAPEGEPTTGAPVIFLRIGGTPARLDDGLRALDVHAMFLKATPIEGIGSTRHLSGRYEYDCKGQVRLHYSFARLQNGTKVPIDHTTPWSSLPEEDQARPCKDAPVDLSDALTLAEAETRVLASARDPVNFGPQPKDIDPAPELKEVCSLIRKGPGNFRFFQTVALPVGPVSPLVALEAAASKREPKGDSLMKKCRPAGRLADDDRAYTVEMLTRRAGEEHFQFSEEPPLRP